MSNPTTHLLSHESAAINEYAKSLQQSLGHQLVGLWLFGSKARGDSDADSDIDLLVVLRNAQPEIRWYIWDLGSDVSLGYDILLNAHIIDAARWDDERRYRGTLWREIERDGVPFTRKPGWDRRGCRPILVPNRAAVPGRASVARDDRWVR
jgi:predicted nucleotidyltransferase